MTRKKIFCTFLLAITLILGIGSTGVYANNHSDTTFSFSLSSTHMSGESSKREKQDTSSTYVNVEQVPSKGAWFSVYGYIPVGDAGTMTWVDETKNGRVILTKGKWLVRQYVYERGGRSAKLFVSKYYQDGTVSGKWSPDSQGAYTYAN